MTLRTQHVLSAAVLAVLALATPATAGPRDFVIYAPGMGGSAAQAKPYLDQFFKYLEKKLGWPEHSGKGEYFEDGKALEAYLEKDKPGYALLPPSYYLALTCKKQPVTLLASVVLTAQGVPAGSSGKFHVVVKKGTAKSLDELKGKKLVSNHLEDLRFVSNVIFAGKIAAETFFVLERSASAVKPFKQVDRGEADAALVDDLQLAHMKTLPFGKDLDVVYSSDALPPAPVVSFDKVAKPAERDALKKALIDMCGTKEGGETCKSMTVLRFDAVEPKTFQAAAQRYCK